MKNLFKIGLILTGIGLFLMIVSTYLKFGTFNTFFDCLLDSRLTKNLNPDPTFLKILFIGGFSSCLGIIFILKDKED